MLFKTLSTYPTRQRLVIFLFVIDIFAWFIAPFSKYYISNIVIYLDLSCLVSLLLIGGGMTSKRCRSIAFVYIIACISIILIPVIVYGDTPFVSAISKLFFTFGFVSLKPQFKWDIYQIFVKLFVILLFLGIIEWLLLLVNINFFWAVVERNAVQIFNHGIFILVPLYSLEGFARFMSLCQEPGTMGTICFFLLTTLDYHKYKREFFVLLTAGLISFSLGFYVLISIWVLMKSRQFRFSQILLGGVAFLIMLTLFGNSFEKRIINRIEGRSIEEIDNRTNEIVNLKMQEITNDGRIYVGMGNRTFYEWEAKMGGVSSGMKNYIFQYGLLGLFILCIAYTTLILQIKGFKKETLILVFLVWVSFYKSNTWNDPPILVSILAIPVTTTLGSIPNMLKQKNNPSKNE